MTGFASRKHALLIKKSDTRVFFGGKNAIPLLPVLDGSPFPVYTIRQSELQKQPTDR
jgi:hypothetical protein